jgi:cytidylate kinase
MARRDEADSTRSSSPLHAADDAIVLDTTDLSVADIVSAIVDRYRTRTVRRSGEQ